MSIDINKRTKGELRLHKHAHANVENDKGRSVANCGGYTSNVDDSYVENEANAAYVVLSWNNHDKLIEALKDVLNALKEADFWANRQDWEKIESAKQLLNTIEKETL